MRYHIHVNALSSTHRHESHFLAIGLSRADFRGITAFQNHYAAKRHYSTKLESKDRALQIYALVSEIIHDEDFVGYVELEEVVFATEVELRGDRTAPQNCPFLLQLRPPQGSRENELHISIEARRDNIPLINSLVQAGMYKTSIYRSGVERAVVTCQGDTQVINAVLSETTAFLSSARGAGLAKLKQERLVDMSYSKGFCWFPPQCFDVRSVS